MRYNVNNTNKSVRSFFTLITFVGSLFFSLSSLAGSGQGVGALLGSYDGLTGSESNFFSRKTLNIPMPGVRYKSSGLEIFKAEKEKFNSMKENFKDNTPGKKDVQLETKKQSLHGGYEKKIKEAKRFFKESKGYNKSEKYKEEKISATPDADIQDNREKAVAKNKILLIERSSDTDYGPDALPARPETQSRGERFDGIVKKAPNNDGKENNDSNDGNGNDGNGNDGSVDEDGSLITLNTSNNGTKTLIINVSNTAVFNKLRKALEFFREGFSDYDSDARDVTRMQINFSCDVSKEIAGEITALINKTGNLNYLTIRKDSKDFALNMDTLFIIIGSFLERNEIDGDSVIRTLNFNNANITSNEAYDIYRAILHYKGDNDKMYDTEDGVRKSDLELKLYLRDNDLNGRSWSGLTYLLNFSDFLTELDVSNNAFDEDVVNGIGQVLKVKGYKGHKLKVLKLSSSSIDIKHIKDGVTCFPISNTGPIKTEMYIYHKDFFEFVKSKLRFLGKLNILEYDKGGSIAFVSTLNNSLFVLAMDRFMIHYHDELMGLGIDNRNIELYGLVSSTTRMSAVASFYEYLLSPYCNLTELDMSNNDIGEDELQDIMRGVKRNKSLKILNLSYAHITDKRSQILADSLSSHPTIEVLILDGNNIGNHGARILADFLQNNENNFSTLSLYCNDHIDPALRALLLDRFSSLYTKGGVKKRILFSSPNPADPDPDPDPDHNPNPGAELSSVDDDKKPSMMKLSCYKDCVILADSSSDANSEPVEEGVLSESEGESDDEEEEEEEEELEIVSEEEFYEEVELKKPLKKSVATYSGGGGYGGYDGYGGRRGTSSYQVTTPHCSAILKITSEEVFDKVKEFAILDEVKFRSKYGLPVKGKIYFHILLHGKGVEVAKKVIEAMESGFFGGFLGGSNSKNYVVEVLDIGGNDLTNSIGEIDFKQSKDYIKYINLNNTGMNDRSLSHILRKLKQCSSLEYLHFNKNEGITEASTVSIVGFFSEAEDSLKELKIFFLDFTFFQDEKKREIVQAIYSSASKCKYIIKGFHMFVGCPDYTRCMREGCKCQKCGKFFYKKNRK